MSAASRRDAPRRAIVLSGGGARGAYEAGVLRYLLDEFPRRTGLPVRFDMICGTSVGAIHACFLAATAERGWGRGEDLVRLWENLQVDEVFQFGPRELISIPRRLLGVRRVAEQLRAGQRPDRLYGLLHTEPLERLVFDAIPWDAIGRNRRAGHFESVCVAATQVATGRSIVFVDQKDPALPPWASLDHIRMQRIRLMPVHALASAAIPLLFPAVRVGARYYVDGGLRLSTPLAPAVRLGANRILVIGLSHARKGEVSEALAQQRTEGFGNPMFLFGKVLDALLLSPLDSDLGRLRFINTLIDHGEAAYGKDFLEHINRVALERTGRPLQRIVDLAIRPTVDLGAIAAELLNGTRGQLELTSPFLRFFARAFGRGREAKEADLLSYLLFDREFAQPLIELGHADASAREEELREFFSD